MMPSLFSRFKGKDGKAKSKKNANLAQLSDQLEKKPRWDDAWTRKTVDAEEVQELIRRCTEELKARGLDMPFLLLPFRPASDPSAVRSFIRHFFDGHGDQMTGDALAQELRMTEPMVISGVIKWCWSRLQGGVVGWDSYELFKVGEQDSNMARDSFNTFIPLSVDSEARSHIIFSFFDLLSATAAHGKMNGFGGRKLSRMAGWWAFEHNDTGNGFEGSYKAWLSAADATSHLFFAYLRSLAPQTSRGGISMLPMSLEKLLSETEYPPQRPALMQTSTNKVVMIVDTVSPTPFALLRRANHFQYRDEDRALREWSDYEDPVQALTEECRRVLRAVSAANQSQAVSSSKHSTSVRDVSWSRFEDIGFAGAPEDDEDYDDSNPSANQRRAPPPLRTAPASGNGLARPTTPSWADFLSSGFVDDNTNSPRNLLLPPDKVLPPIETAVRQRSSQSHRPRLESDGNLEPGELASITRFDLDDAFWWAWMSSLAPEETQERKSAFGRCAVIETVIRGGRWLVMEEMVKGAAPEPEAGAYIAEKKGFFSWTRRNRGVIRRKSTGKQGAEKVDGGLKPSGTIGFSKTSIGPDQQAKIQAAAQQLQARQLQEKQASRPLGRRGRTDAELIAEKTNSVLTLQTSILHEASPAVKWANKYDKEAIREAYLANSSAGRGHTDATAITQENGHSPSIVEERPEVPAKSPASVVPAPAPTSPQDEEASPVGPTDKELEAPRDIHPVERQAEVGRSTPAPPPKDTENLELARENMLSPDPQLSPESKKRMKKLHKEKEKDSRAGGLRKLFTRKNRQSKLPENAADQLKTMGVTEDRSSAPTPEPSERPTMENEEPQFVMPIEQPADITPTPSPVAALAPASIIEPTYEPAEEGSRIDTADAAEARDEFSRFDQGPLLDQPAFVAEADNNDEVEEDSTDEAIPPPIVRHPSRSPQASPQAAPGEGEVTPKALPAQDRWAQIRKNAAERAAQNNYEEPNRGRYSKATTEGDDDTSGEETIESRVARIKARVAELTGNMESGAGGAGPGSRTPPVRR